MSVKNPVKELEQRIETLEKRFAELEAKLSKAATPDQVVHYHYHPPTIIAQEASPTLPRPPWIANNYVVF